MAFIADTTPIKLQLKLTNYAETMESKPRYHVRRISFIITILEDDEHGAADDDVVKLLSEEDQKVLTWQARTENLQDDIEVRNDLTHLSGRLCPYKKIALSLYDRVTDQGILEPRHQLSAYRLASFRSAMLTKHSLGEVQLLFSYDGLPGDRSCLRWRSHDYIKLVLPHAKPSYRVFWLVQWDIEDKLDPIGHVDATGRRIRMNNYWRSSTSSLDPALYPAMDPPVDSGKFQGIRRCEKRKSPWIAEVRPRGVREKIWLGSYKTPEAAARAADAGQYYYNLNRSLNFRDSPCFLRPIPPNLNDKDKEVFVKGEARRLALLLTEGSTSSTQPSWDHLDIPRGNDDYTSNDYNDYTSNNYMQPVTSGLPRSDGFETPILDSENDLVPDLVALSSPNSNVFTAVNSSQLGADCTYEPTLAQTLRHCSWHDFEWSDKDPQPDISDAMIVAGDSSSETDIACVAAVSHHPNDYCTRLHHETQRQTNTYGHDNSSLLVAEPEQAEPDREYWDNWVRWLYASEMEDI